MEVVLVNNEKRDCHVATTLCYNICGNIIRLDLLSQLCWRL